jgi:hypothetical protein
MAAGRGILQQLFRGRPRVVASTPRSVINAWLTRARAAQTGDGGLQRRSRQRWRWTYLIVVRAGDTEFESVAADISSSGVGLLAPQRIAEGIRVWLRDLRGSDWVAARVRHVRPTDDHDIYRIGMEFEDDADDAARPPRPGTP